MLFGLKFSKFVFTLSGLLAPHVANCDFTSNIDHVSG